MSSFTEMSRIGKSVLCELHLNLKIAKEIITLPHNPLFHISFGFVKWLIFQIIRYHAWIKFLQPFQVHQTDLPILSSVNTTCYLLFGIYLNYNKIFAY